MYTIHQPCPIQPTSFNLWHFDMLKQDDVHGAKKSKWVFLETAGLQISCNQRNSNSCYSWNCQRSLTSCLAGSWWHAFAFKQSQKIWCAAKELLSSRTLWLKFARIFISIQIVGALFVMNIIEPNFELLMPKWSWPWLIRTSICPSIKWNNKLWD